jgi:hypothetical protein
LFGLNLALTVLAQGRPAEAMAVAAPLVAALESAGQRFLSIGARLLLLPGLAAGRDAAGWDREFTALAAGLQTLQAADVDVAWTADVARDAALEAGWPERAASVGAVAAEQRARLNRG